MGQGRKRRLLSLPKECFENMSGQNSLFSITNTKETKLSLIGGKFWTLGTLLSPYYSGPDETSMEKEVSKPHKGMMRYHEESQFIPFLYILKG